MGKYKSDRQATALTWKIYPGLKDIHMHQQLSKAAIGKCRLLWHNYTIALSSVEIITKVKICMGSEESVNSAFQNRQEGIKGGQAKWEGI